MVSWSTQEGFSLADKKGTFRKPFGNFFLFAVNKNVRNANE